MKKTLINPTLEIFPEEFHKLISGSNIFDSSCSNNAKVYFIDKEQGYFLKTAPKGTLETQSILTDYFHKKGFARPVLSYISREQDWLLMEKTSGEDCTFEEYLKNPKKLSHILGSTLRELHETDFSDCPIKDRNQSYIALAEENFKKGLFDKSYLLPCQKDFTAEDAFKTASTGKHLLKNEVLLHGDYCLPNVMLNNWSFSGFIDLDHGGVGDRHIDLFWGAWSLEFNLKTDEFREPFFDAYGKKDVDREKIKIISCFEAFG